MMLYMPFYNFSIILSLFLMVFSKPIDCCEEREKNEEKSEISKINEFSQDVECIRRTLEMTELSDNSDKDKDSEKTRAINILSIDEIFSNYEIASKEFTELKKRKFLQKEGHILFIDFIKKYIKKNIMNPIELDITNLSSRSRIYLLRGIINFKLRNAFLKNTSKWKKNESSPTLEAEFPVEFIDQCPIIFQIGNYAYQLQVFYKETEPNKGDVCGVIYGLINKRIGISSGKLKKTLKDYDEIFRKPIESTIINVTGKAGLHLNNNPDTYDDIFRFLQKYDEELLLLFKEKLISQKKTGYPILFGYEENNSRLISEKLQINQFLNGLNLLFDIEIACKLSRNNESNNLPIIATMPYALNSFEKLETLKSYIDNIFRGERSAIEDYIKHIIKSENKTKTIKQTRSILTILHNDDEDSQEEDKESNRRQQRKESKSENVAQSTPLQPWEIYKIYQTVSDQFLSLEKRKYLQNETHLSLLKFMQEYLNGKKSTIVLTGLSSRCRIYLLSEVTDFKLRYRPFPAKWIKKTRPPIAGGESYDEYIDQFPTIFQIGNHSYRLKNAWTKNKPGGGKIYGIIEENDANKKEKADTYVQIVNFLKKYELQALAAIKGALIDQKKDGLPITLSGATSEIENQKLDTFCNGFNLLLDFEVARRLAQGDVCRSLPIITALPILFNCFSQVNTLSNIFTKLFAGTPYDRKEFLKTIIVHKNKNEIRNTLKAFHKEDEESEDEESEDEAWNNIMIKYQLTNSL